MQSLISELREMLTITHGRTGIEPKQKTLKTFKTNNKREIAWRKKMHLVLLQLLAAVSISTLVKISHPAPEKNFKFN